MVLATIEVDLIAPVDGVLGTDLDAGVAAGTNIEIDRIFLAPRDVECSQPAADRFDAAGIHRISPLLRQFRARRAPGNEHRHGKVRTQALGPGQRSRGGTDNQQLSARLEADTRHRLRIGQRGGGDQGGDLGWGGWRLAAPSRALANIDEAYRLRLAGVVGDVAEEPRLLGARDKDVAARAVGKSRQLLLAKLRMDRQRSGKLQRTFENGGIEQHGAVAIAHMNIALSVVLRAHDLAALPSTPVSGAESAISLGASAGATGASEATGAPGAVGESGATGGAMASAGGATILPAGSST